MSLDDLAIRKFTQPLEEELNRQKEKNGRLRRQIQEAKEEVREACAHEARTALLEAGEDPRAADSMFSRIRGVELTREPLKKALWEVFRLLDGSINAASPLSYKVLIPARDLIKDILEEP